MSNLKKVNRLTLKEAKAIHSGLVQNNQQNSSYARDVVDRIKQLEQGPK